MIYIIIFSIIVFIIVIIKFASWLYKIQQLPDDTWERIGKVCQLIELEKECERDWVELKKIIGEEEFNNKFKAMNERHSNKFKEITGQDLNEN